jgi:flagellar biosynthesis/type III secretory pathway chaperone
MQTSSVLPPPSLTMIEYTQRLLETLRKEYEALSKSDIAALEDIVQIKQQLFAEFETLLKQHFDGAHAIIDVRLRGVIEECFRQNTINGALINVNRQHTELALSILRGHSLSVQLYDASGATPTNLTSNSLGCV